MSEPVKLWRYTIPSVEREGWAIVVIGSDGFCSAVSDWGNYSFRWTATGCADFRDFVLRAQSSPAYWINKLGGDDVYDAAATEAEVKDYIEDPDSFGSTKSAKARRAREIELLQDSDLRRPEGFDRWLEQTGLDDAWEYRREKPDPHATAFVTRAMPRICALIQAELAAERGAGVVSAPV